MKTVKWAVAILLVVVFGMFVTPDVFPSLHTFGVSIGTNTHYCSGDLVNWVPQFGCQGGE